MKKPYSIILQPVSRQTTFHLQEEIHFNADVIQKESIQSATERLGDLVKIKTGRKAQKKAVLLREGKIHLNSEHTIKDVERICKVIENRFGIYTIQIHLHQKHFYGEQFKKHAHVVLGWIDQSTGKSIKLYRADLHEMQGLVKNELDKPKIPINRNNILEKLMSIL